MAQQGQPGFHAAVHILREQGRFSGIIAFHSQQAAEKYLKALLVRNQVDFPKTHDIGRLLDRVATVDPATADALREAEALTPFGVEVRYPSDAPELLAGEDNNAVEIAQRARDTVIALLAQYLSGK